MQSQPLWPTYVQAVSAGISVIIVLISTVTTFILARNNRSSQLVKQNKVASIIGGRLRRILDSLERVSHDDARTFVEMDLFKGLPDDFIVSTR